MDDDVKQVMKDAGVSGTNAHMLMLDAQARLVHAFLGYNTSGSRNPTYFRDELAKGLAEMKLPRAAAASAELTLPDVKGPASPAGVRIFVRAETVSFVVVEAVPMKPEEWKALRHTGEAREIEAENLRSWWAQLYPSGIRAADQRKPFKKITGALRLKPAGTEGKLRYAILSGAIGLAKEDEGSSFDGSVEAVVTYGLDGPEVGSVRGVVEGRYRYRPGRGEGEAIRIRAALESRPE